MPRHLTRQQEKAIFSKLKAKGFAQKPIKITEEGKHIRARIISPKKFQKGTFRTIPAGKDNKGGARLIVARTIGKRTTKVQSILIPR